ncbi:protein phosphatase 1 regulatory subunit 3C-B-like [Brienomyrus brachyistius]|uniref:protein phosphatase 1 regulatory subunit 3C-B-like n=1 Tax=Brienomyrus brachyistius TaxID=42636 RepID=UPI0020B457B3|nr:protein phosphatase 1 regulatory subunit 3C-B-like [Brienomyrus brachyistius]
MNCTKVLQIFGGHSYHQQAMPLDLAVKLCLSQSPPLRRLLAVSPLKAQSQYYSSQQRWQEPVTASRNQTEVKTPVSIIRTGGGSKRKKNVVFADALGLSLTAVRFFETEDDASPPLRDFGVVAKPLGCTDRAAVPGSLDQRACRLQLGFPQPWTDFPAFHARLAGGMVHLESCSVTPRGLSGTVRVRNTSFEKAVHIRITFDSWRSYHDVPCTYLQQRAGAGGETDTFAFDIHLPHNLDPEKCIEFCVSYRSTAFAEPLWDNNRGQNYRVFVCVDPEAVYWASAPQSNYVRKPLHDGSWCPHPNGAQNGLNCSFDTYPAIQSWSGLQHILPFC